MSHTTVTYYRDLLELILFLILVPLILYEVWKLKGKGVGAKVLEQGAVIP